MKKQIQILDEINFPRGVWLTDVFAIIRTTYRLHWFKIDLIHEEKCKPGAAFNYTKTHYRLTVAK